MVSATPQLLYLREIDPRPIVQEAGRAMGSEYNGRENFVLTGLRIPDRLARSESKMPAVHFSKSPVRDM